MTDPDVSVVEAIQDMGQRLSSQAVMLVEIRDLLALILKALEKKA